MLRYVVAHPLGVLLPVAAPEPEDDVVGFADVGEDDRRLWLEDAMDALRERARRN